MVSRTSPRFAFAARVCVSPTLTLCCGEQYRSRLRTVLQFWGVETEEKLAILFGLLFVAVILVMAAMRGSEGCHDEPCGNASPPATDAALLPPNPPLQGVRRKGRV